MNKIYFMFTCYILSADYFDYHNMINKLKIKSFTKINR